MKYWPVLLVIILFTSVLWLHDLSRLPNGLYWDEMDSGYQAYSLVKTGRDYFNNPLPLFPHSFADYQTPVFIYSAVPFVAKLGLSALSVRLPSVLWAVLGLLTLFVLTNLLLRQGLLPGLFAVILAAFSPWYFHFGRLGFQISALLTIFCLAVACFLHSLRHPRWLPVSALFFVLSAYAYSTAKLLAPLLVLFLFLTHFRYLLSLPRRYLVFSALVLSLFALMFVGGSNTRLHDLAVFTDPQVKSQVNYLRQQFDISNLSGPQVGVKSSFIGRLLINQPGQWFRLIEANYLSAFSTDFLFISGDPQLRHNPGQVGMLSPVLFPLLLLGLFYLLSLRSRPDSRLLLFWLFLSPLPSALTRDGATHSLRLSLLLPPLLILAVLGFNLIIRKSKLLFLLLLFCFLFSSFSFLAFYFTFYRFDSAAPFQWGFPEIINTAVTSGPAYDRVFIDTANDSALMAYLFTIRFDPVRFHQLLPLNPTSISSSLTGYEFGRVIVLPPGSRDWQSLSHSAQFAGHTSLVIASAAVPGIDRMQPFIRRLNYPDGTPAFYIFSLPH